jgi:hypothetical protein
MAWVESVNLDVTPGAQGQTLFSIKWTTVGSNADGLSRTVYEQSVELVANGQHLGGDAEIAPTRHVYDGSVNLEQGQQDLTLSIDKVRAAVGASPLQDLSIFARVTLTPVSTSGQSDPVKFDGTTHP